MPRTTSTHMQAVAGAELRNFEWRKVANVAALPATGQAGEIITVTATGVDYQWNAVLSVWVPWHSDGSVLRQNITGAASVDLTRRSAAELTLTGNVTALAFTGWSTDTTITQRVRVQVIEDATGGRTFAWQNVSGVWLETPPAALDTTALGSPLQFYAITTNGGTTVWLEPVGVNYSQACLYMLVAESPVPAVTALGSVTVAHTYSMVASVELIEIATGRRVVADWRHSVPSDPASSVIIDFAAAHPAGTYRVRVSGMATTPCGLTVTTSEWESTTLSFTSTTTVTTTLTHNGAAAAVQWVYPDATTANAATGVAVSKVFGAATTGNIVLRWRKGVAITAFTDSVTRWTFNVSALPRSLTSMTLTAALGTPTGALSGLPRSLTSAIFIGNTLSGDIGSLPTTTTVFRASGTNTISGDVATLPAGLTQLLIAGSTTVFGNIGSLPATLTQVTLNGATTVTGNVALLPPALTLLNLTGSNSVFGDVGAIPDTVTSFNVVGLNTISGDVQGLPPGMITFVLQGNNTTGAATTPLPFTVALRRFVDNAATAGTGFDQVEVDAILAAIDALGTVGVGLAGGDINLTGAGNAAPSAAGLVSRANLVGRAWTVITN